jgi:hypothetical protein
MEGDRTDLYGDVAPRKMGGRKVSTSVQGATRQKEDRSFTYDFSFWSGDPADSHFADQVREAAPSLTPLSAVQHCACSHGDCFDILTSAVSHTHCTLRQSATTCTNASVIAWCRSCVARPINLQSIVSRAYTRASTQTYTRIFARIHALSHIRT